MESNPAFEQDAQIMLVFKIGSRVRAFQLAR